jgi:TM2 domain-containing membrane protein YozV
MSDLVPKRKSVTVAVVLALLAGALGAHRFYLGQTGRGLVMLGVLAASILVTVSNELGEFALLVPGLWSLADCVLMPGEIRRLNDEAEAQVIMQVHGLAPARMRSRL